MSAVRDNGSDIRIVFGRIDPERDAEPAWYFLSHAEFDGIGGFGRLLREHGHPDLRVLPEFRSGAPASLPKLVTAAARFTAFPWHGSCATLAGVAVAPQPRKVAWHVFDRERTLALAARAKREQVSVNSLLLFAFNRAFAPLLDSPDRVARWMIPVNMRGLMRGPSDTVNHVSYLRIGISRDDSPQSIQSRIRSHIEHQEHWLMWYAYRYATFVGAAAMRFLARVDMKWGRSLTGSFSNLGNWDLAGPSSWIFCPPVAIGMPIGGGCVTYAGRLGIAAQIYPAYENGAALAKTAMKEWVRLCGV